MSHTTFTLRAAFTRHFCIAALAALALLIAASITSSSSASGAELVSGATEPIILSNGMRLVVRERHTAPIVAVDLWVKAGSAEELAGENGCAHFLEHTLFKGTAARSAGTADFAIESLGGELNAATGADYAHYYTELPAAHLAEAAAVISDIVRNATFPDAEVERERIVILDELARRGADQFSRIQDRLYSRAFAGKPYSLSPGGLPQSIRDRARDTLIEFYRRLYVPSRCTLAIAGDVTAADAKRIAESAFGSWNTKAPDAAEQKTAALPPNAVPEMANQEVRPAIGVAYPAPAAHTEQLVCIARVCAAMLESRFKGPEFAGTQLEVHYTPRLEPSLMVITAALPSPAPTRPFEKPAAPTIPNLDSLETAIRVQVSALSTGQITDVEVAAAAAAARGQILYDTETDAGLARAAGLADVLGAEGPEQEIARLGTITAADVRLFAAEWLAQGRAIVDRSNRIAQ